MMSAKICVIAALLAIVSGQVPDDSGCKICKERYSEWFLSKRINSSIWEVVNNTKLTADNLCSEAQDIYYNCFMTCLKDSNGNSAPHTDDSNAKALNTFLTESCLQHECRLADTLMCSHGSGRNKCLPESLECSLRLLAGSGCNPAKLCHEAERQAYITNTKERINCYATYPDFVSEDVPESDESRKGLQVCKDVILVGCLEKWHDKKDNHDFKRFVEFDEEFQQEMCSRDVYNESLTCLENAINGTVTYEGQEYEQPCDLSLMKNFSGFMLKNGVIDLLFAYDYMCSPFYRCGVNGTALNETLPSLNETSTEDLDVANATDFNDTATTVGQIDVTTVNDSTTESDIEGTTEESLASTTTDSTDDYPNEATTPSESDSDSEKPGETDHDDSDDAKPDSDTDTESPETPPDSEHDHSEHDHKHPGPSKSGKAGTGQSKKNNGNAVYVSSVLLCMLPAIKFAF